MSSASRAKQLSVGHPSVSVAANWVRQKHKIQAFETMVSQFEKEFNVKCLYDEQHIGTTYVEFASEEELLMFLMRWS